MARSRASLGNHEGLCAANRVRLEDDLAHHKTRSIFHPHSLEEVPSKPLLDAWPVLACGLRIATTAGKDVMAIWLPLRDVYGTTQ